MGNVARFDVLLLVEMSKGKQTCSPEYLLR